LKCKRIAWNFLERREEKLRLFEENVYGFYSEHSKLFIYILLLELLACFTGVVEAYLILSVTTGHSSLLTAFIIESVNRVINVAFAFVPMRVGVDEGGVALTLNALGYTVADGVSLAIIRKIRIFFWTGIGLLIIARYSLSGKSGAQPPAPGVEERAPDIKHRM